MAPKDGSSASRPSGSDQVTKSYASSLLNLADSVTGTFTSTLTSLSYPPVVSAARMAILSMMNQSIKYGKLRILTDQGVYTFPPDAKDSEEAAEIRVIRDTFWLRLVTLGDLGFAEAYMSGDCEVSDLVKVFQVCCCRQVQVPYGP
jgi:cyclopropane-fatty-acyl-phospholipid synthase